MATVASFFNKFLTLLLLLLHLGCFTFASHLHHRESPKKKRKAFRPSSWSYFKRVFSPNYCKQNDTDSHPPPTISARSSQQSILLPIVAAETAVSDSPVTVRPGSAQESDISSDNPFFPLRNDIFPCPACGEIFQKPHLLDTHQSIKHAVSELLDGDSGKNIVRIIFKTGWTEKDKTPKIHRILKIHNSPKILARFEEYRESVKLNAARHCVALRRDERCIADGNELLRFHCSTFLCELGQNGNSGICGHQYCSVCGIIRAGFSPKMDGISTLSNSWRAHVAIPDDVEQEFAFMGVKRAMLVCRVVAGRVGLDQDVDADLDKEDGGFDSVVGRGAGPHHRLDEEELLVFNPRAVLPCFVIVYGV
ncbi:uncharacterized protein LOC131148834 [Malania oleifera]|uniref:uncharacterized protein LOC131148834 n=1 Tax=Malania oleifera TaxID=397392 RepID=UPI0025AE15C9|nr:uncharacterized protein LOC131148834 [Malania oleifera]